MADDTNDEQDPLAGLARLLGELRASIEVLKQQGAAAVEAFNQTRASAVEAFDRAGALYRAVTPETINRLREIGAGLVRFAEYEHRLAEAGWLPHPTISLGLLESAADADASALSQAIEDHYRNDWSLIKSVFVDRIRSYTIDDEAKETFRQGLLAHEHALYRVAPRLLFPEIERVTRVDFYKDDVSEKITNQCKLRKIAKELAKLPLGDVDSSLYAARFYEKLFDLVYVRSDSEERRASITSNPIPNRNAAIHGTVSYHILQHSANMLIMTDYIFELISAIKRRGVGSSGTP